jgi:hypothetical protein
VIKYVANLRELPPLPAKKLKTERSKVAMRNFVARLFVVMAIAAVGAFGADNSVGTWKYNAAKSKTTSTKKIKSRIEVREATPDGGIKVTRTGEYMDGTPIKASYTCKYDGKECPVTGEVFDTISIKRIDEYTVSYAAKKTGGKYHMTGQTVVSKDGKTRTQTASGTDAEGKPVSSTTVFDKQ